MRVFLAALILCLCGLSPSFGQELLPERYPGLVSPGGGTGGVRTAKAQIIPHPAGCPARAFCGCGAAVRVFGKSVRELWLARNWFRFPRSSPGPGMVAVRRGHVFVLEQHVGGNDWLASDYNSGNRLSRLHVRSIAGYVIVNPHARNLASAS